MGLGLWHQEFAYAPFDIPGSEAEGYLAVSPSLTVREPVCFTGMLNEVGPLAVELKDVSGRPAAGIVEIGEYSNFRQSVVVGSAGPGGVVEFKGVPMHQYAIKARVAGCRAPEIRNAPMPDKAALTDVTAIPWVPVESRPNAAQRIVLQEQKVGYVLGILKPPVGHTTQDYRPFLRIGDYHRGTELHYEPDTGKFVTGPFLPGVAHLRVGYGSQYVVPLAEREVTIEPGKVATVDLAPREPPKDLPAGAHTSVW